VPGYVGFRTMSLISEGPQTRGHGSTSQPLPRSAGMSSRSGSAPSKNAVRASQARAALLREARRDEQAVAHWLRELARPHR
jgi:hypothetical protein